MKNCALNIKNSLRLDNQLRFSTVVCKMLSGDLGAYGCMQRFWMQLSKVSRNIFLN